MSNIVTNQFNLGIRFYLTIRKFIELVVVLLTAPISLLLGVVIAIAIKIDDGEAVFFIQKRVGKNGIPFQMLKFRTMIVRQKEGFRLEQKEDTRITKIGKLLRRFRLDELPQLLHLLSGKMNFIGPRPVPFELYAHYQKNIKDYDTRHQVSPGITGWAQVKLGYTNSTEGERKKVALDNYYIQNIGLLLDLLILWKTLFTRD